MPAAGGPGPDRATIVPGTEVVSADGRTIGKVKEVGDAAFRADRAMARDITVPCSAIESSNGRMVLRVPAGELDRVTE